MVDDAVADGTLVDNMKTATFGYDCQVQSQQTGAYKTGNQGKFKQQSRELLQ